MSRSIRLLLDDEAIAVGLHVATGATVMGIEESAVRRWPSWSGPIDAIDARTSAVRTSSDNVSQLAVWLGLLDAKFEVTDPRNLSRSCGLSRSATCGPSGTPDPQ